MVCLDEPWAGRAPPSTLGRAVGWGGAIKWRWRDTFRYGLPPLLIGLSLAGSCCGADDARRYCDTLELQQALASAAPGQTVHVGACRIEGAFRVPGGVAISGEGPDVSVLASVGAQRETVLQVVPGRPATRVVGLAVESGANYGVLASGDGDVEVERLRIHAERGVAFAAQDLASLTMTEVQLGGLVTASNATTVSQSPEDSATHGLILLRVSSVEFADVTATGFALVGALLVESTTTWRGGGAPVNLGTGLLVDGGVAHLEDLDLSATLDGDHVMPAYGGAFIGGAQVDTSRLDVSDGADFGLLHDAVVARHVDLTANRNWDVGVWAQACDAIEVSGGTLEGNGYAGVVALDSVDVRVHGVAIGQTIARDHVIEGTSTRMAPVGDGVQIVRASGAIEIRDVGLRLNDRAGLVVELGGRAMDDSVVIAGVTIEGTGEARGAVVEDATGAVVPTAWEAGLSRDSVTQANDDAHRGERLDVVPGLAAGERPSAGVRSEGLASIIDPEPPP